MPAQKIILKLYLQCLNNIKTSQNVQRCEASVGTEWKETNDGLHSSSVTQRKRLMIDGERGMDGMSGPVEKTAIQGSEQNLEQREQR